ncbi:uncharacterized protein LOC131882650 [Tigriopus californicus]|uniref:uncharacterized protein LOC131882650 n=1 Tax=Tigriopus californicus TaxID=6832 RepID=UPI0027DA2F6E|nr:uncharacterized protein LOC131882650 [Tigriopus californicus]
MDLNDSIFPGPDQNWPRPPIPPIRHPWELEGGYGSEVRPLILPPRGGMGRGGLSGRGTGSSLYAPSSVSHASREHYYEDHLMRPGRLPVLNPEAVQTDHLHLHLNRLSREVQASLSPDARQLVDSYIPTQEMVEYFERLDVLLCGKCQSVFHVLEEFKSHKSGCRGESNHGRSGQESSDYALALTLWYNTLIRKIEQAGVPYAEQEDLRQYIQSKFYRLSWKSKQKWQKVARHVRKLCSEGQVLFGAVDLRKDLLREYHPPLWVEGENGPSMLELKQEVSTQWPSLGVEEIANPGSRTLPKMSLLRSVRTLVPKVPGKNMISSPILDPEPELEPPEVLEILAQRNQQYCVIIKGRRDPKWMDARDLSPKLIATFHKPTRSVGVASVPMAKTKTKNASTMSVPQTHSIATETLPPKLISRTTETISPLVSSVGTETVVPLVCNVETETRQIQTKSIGVGSDGDPLPEDSVSHVKQNTLPLVVTDVIAGAPEVDEELLEPVHSQNKTSLTVISNDSPFLSVPHPPLPVKLVLPSRPRDSSPDPSLKSPPRASRLKALTKMKRWAKDKSVSSSEGTPTPIDRPSTPLSDTLADDVEEETILTQGTFGTVMGAFQAEFEKSLSSQLKRDQESFKSALIVDSPTQKPWGGNAHWWLKKNASSPLKSGKTWNEVPTGGKVEVIRLGVVGGARTLREELETNVRLRQGPKRGRPKGSCNKVPSVKEQKRLKVKLTMGRKRPLSGHSFEANIQEELDNSKVTSDDTKEPFGLQFSDEDMDLDLSPLRTRGRKRKRPKDEKPRIVKAKKKRKSNPPDDLADEEIAKIIPKGFTVIPQFSGKGTVEYVVRKERDETQSKSSKSISAKTSSSNAPPKVLEFGSRKISSASLSSKESSNVKTIFLNSEQGAKDALHKQRGAPHSSPSILPGPEDKDKSSQFVKLTYRPTEQDLLMSNQYPRRPNETKVGHPRHSPNSFEVTSTTDSNMDLQDGILDKNQEVSTTTATTAKDNPPEEDSEYTLDPISGLLVDKEGNPLQVKDSQPTFAQLRPPLALPNASSMPPAESSARATVPFNVLSQAQMVQVSVPIPMETQANPNHLLLHAGHQAPPGYTSNTSDITQSTMSFDPSMQGLQPSFQISEDGGIVMSSMEQNTGTLSADQTNNPVQYATTMQGVPGTSNKVLLVLPGGQMILTDLTDEQCGQLNIQVEQSGDGSTVSGVPQVIPAHPHGPNQHAGVSPEDVSNNIQFTFTTDNLTAPLTSQQPVPVLAPTTTSSHTNPAFLSSAEISNLPIALETLENGKEAEKEGTKGGEGLLDGEGDGQNSKRNVNELSADKP